MFRNPPFPRLLFLINALLSVSLPIPGSLFHSPPEQEGKRDLTFSLTFCFENVQAFRKLERSKINPGVSFSLNFTNYNNFAIFGLLREREKATHANRSRPTSGSAEARRMPFPGLSVHTQHTAASVDRPAVPPARHSDFMTLSEVLHLPRSGRTQLFIRT